MTTAQHKALKAIGEAAAEWAVRLNAETVEAADKAEFMQWLRQSPVHVEEYLHAEILFLAMQGAAQGNAGEVRALLHEASPNVVGLPFEAAADIGDTRRATLPGFISRPLFLVAAMAVAASIAVGIAFALHASRGGDTVYTTRIGEQRRVMLPDGSAIDLNTHSSVRVSLTATSRDMHLTGGEAFFDVAKDPRRPFRVISGTAVVRAVGTRFNVLRLAGKTVVTVVEGRVAVASSTPGATGAEVLVDTGQGIDVGAAQPTTANTHAATAWRQRRLIFEDRTLSEVVAEFNRYNRRQFAIEDPALAGERISGVFDADKPEDLVGFLLKNGAAQVDDSAGGRILLAPPR